MQQQTYCIEVMNRLYRASLKGSAVKIEMGTPQEVQWDIALNFQGQSLNAHHLNTGVPHTIIFVDSIDQVKLAELGPHIRYHALWKPNGTNLTIAQQVAPHRFKVRTYERGVEAETLACGTGATAAALAAAYQCHLTGPLTMQTQLGEELTIDFKLNHKHFSDVTLTGPAQRIFEGEIDLVK
jgi:diaminopimelate epimerase